MTGMIVEPYSQHDWSNTIWALMLAGMVTAFFLGMLLFLVMVGRAKAYHSLRVHHRFFRRS